MSNRTRIMLEGAISAALAMALSFIPLKIGSGFSISLGMIPLIIYAFRRGVKPGLVAGLVWGLLHFLLGKASILTVSQALIEYILAYTAVGFAGIYKTKIQTSIEKHSSKVWTYVGLGVLVGVVARYFFHFLAGVIFWGEYAMWGLSPVVYSLVMNGSSALLTGIVTYMVVMLLLKKKPSLFIPKN